MAEKALAHTPDNAAKLLDAWQLEDALGIAQELFFEDPNNPDMWILAAEVLHQRGQHLAAIRLLQNADKAGASVPQSLQGLIQSSAEYATQFKQRESAHFRISYLDKDEIVATYAEPVLEAAYKNIGTDLEIFPAERHEKISVEIYPDARGLAGATGLTVKEIETSGTIAVCKFHRLMITSPLATADGYAWADTVAHEFTHLLISKKSRNTVPIWLHEGIAKFYESRWNGAAGRALGAYSEKLLADAVRKNKFITFAQMHPSMAKLPSQEDAALAFAEVFTVIEYLTESFGKSSVPQILALLGQDLELDKALLQVTGMDLKNVESAWKKYLLKRRFQIVPGAKPERIELSNNDVNTGEGVKPLETIEDREVHNSARLGELLHLRGHSKAAIVEYERAYARAGVRYATLATRLARAYVENERPGDALRIADAILGVHPEENDAHLIAGRINLQQRAFDKAQAHFEAVRLQNPFNPEIHAALGALYDAKKQNSQAEQERVFLDLSRRPRPTRSYELPAAPQGDSLLSVVAKNWVTISLDGGPALAIPIVNYALSSGKHAITWTNASGASKRLEVTTEPSKPTVAVLPDM